MRQPDENGPIALYLLWLAFLEVAGLLICFGFAESMANGFAGAGVIGMGVICAAAISVCALVVGIASSCARLLGDMPSNGKIIYIALAIHLLISIPGLYLFFRS
ncbi:conserved membrane hypothetical protein [Burkholderia diffusa]|uniref:hypothetical protein n=1 Tax=Burkholderia diffusa TaxID=488732 RepID=UPI001CB3451E|nr:hypothetical protein [Burkholderia diffusa]CAG9250188.1 conserved membrane hypothetical protein [Burkholderia diffusa]